LKSLLEHVRVDVEQARQLVRTRGLVGAARVVDPVRAPEGLPGVRNGHPAA